MPLSERYLRGNGTGSEQILGGRMFKFRVLGTIDLTGADGRRVGSILNQPKRLALLALEAPRRLQREEVMGRLWPEMSDERARNALRQALHYLRRSLGPGVIAGKGEEGVGIAPGSMECDASELVRAVEEGRFGAALALYEGELLPGFHVEGAPVELDHWLDDSRRRLQRMAGEAARSLARTEEAAGNVVAAAAAARRAWELGNWGEPALQELLRLLIRAGDEKGARETYADFARKLRRDHGAEPSPESRGIIRSIGEGAGTVDGDMDAAAAAPAAGPGPESSRQESAVAAGGGGVEGRPVGAERPWRWWAAAVAAAVAVGLGVWALEGADPVAEAAAEGPLALYLEPVRDLRSPGEEPAMAEVITMELAAQLSESSQFRVVALSPAEAPASEVGVRLCPTLREVEDGLQLSVLLLDPASSAVLNRVTVEVEEGSARTPELLAGRAGPQIRRGVGDVLTLRVLRAEGAPPAALAALRAGSAELDAAMGLWASGAVTPARHAYAEADALFLQAIELDPGWPEPRLRRAEAAVKVAWMHLSPPTADRGAAHAEILRGLEVADRAMARTADQGRALDVRGYLAYWAGQTADSPEDQAVFHEAAERDLVAAVEQDPGLARAWSTLSVLAEQRADYGAAYHRARRAYIADYSLRVPVDIMVRLFTNALEVGDVEGAARWCQETHRRRPAHWAGYYCDLRQLAWTGPFDVARSDSLLREGLERIGPAESAANVGLRLELVHAVVLAKAGDEDGARALLRSAEGITPTTPDLLDLEAWVRLTLGDRVGALRLLSRASELHPAAARSLVRSHRYTDLGSYMLAQKDE